MNWLPAALSSLLAFGLWGFFSKLTVQHIDAKSALIFQTVGVIFTACITLGMMNFRPAVDTRGIMLATLTGIAYGFGCLLYFVAASRGKVTTVVTLTALYPLITIGLSSALLRETISLRQWSGIGLALLAILLMAG